VIADGGVTGYGVRAFAIAPGGGKWALIRSTPFLLEVYYEKSMRTVELTQLNKVSDLAPDPSIDWSADGRFLAVLYNSAETESTVEVYDLLGPTKIFTSAVGDAKWLKAGHKLICVPAKSALGSLSTPGLLVFDAAARRKYLIQPNQSFDGGIATARTEVIAQAASLSNGAIIRRIVRIRIE
jgi:hypothetical protein